MSQAPVGGAGSKPAHAPIGRSRSSGPPHVRPAAAHSTFTSWPLKQPTALLPSQRFADAEQPVVVVAQTAPSAPNLHLRPNVA